MTSARLCLAGGMTVAAKVLRVRRLPCRWHDQSGGSLYRPASASRAFIVGTAILPQLLYAGCKSSALSASSDPSMDRIGRIPDEGIAVFLRDPSYIVMTRVVFCFLAWKDRGMLLFGVIWES